MIFFNKDWHDENGKRIAIPHVDTDNYSFKRICMVLRKMGIKNHMFPLALSNPALIGHDPHNLKDNSLELKKMIANEAQINIWYFLREMLRIPVPGGSYGTPFEAHRGNISLAWSFLNGIDIINIQPRQTGKTTCKLALDTWIIYLHGKNMIQGLLTKDDILRQENISRIKNMRDLLPRWIIKHSSQDINNKQGILYKDRNNAYKTHIGLSDKIKAQSVGRGNNYVFVHMDEFGYIDNIEIIHPVIMASQSESRKRAAEHGMVHANVYTTTAGSLSTKSGEYAYNILNDAMVFTDMIYDVKNVEEARKIVFMNSKNDKINATWSYEQLGKDKRWFHDVIRKLGAKESDIDRDFLNIWKHDSDFSVLSKKTIEKLNKGKKEPLFTEVTSEGYIFNWYLPESIVKSEMFKKKPLVLSMDSSENIGRDFSSLTVLDPKTMSVAGTLRCNESNVINLAKYIGNLLVIYEKMTLVPERKSTGPTMIDQIILILVENAINPFKRIYNKIVQDSLDININKNIHDTKFRKYLGFQTTGKSRPYLYKNILMKATRLNHERIYDTTIIRELAGLNMIGGRVDHGDNAHDDSALSYLLACWFIYEGKNLHVYGLDISDILMDDAENHNGSDMNTAISIMNRIKHYDNLITNAGSDLTKRIFEKKKQLLEDELKEKNITLEPFTHEHLKQNYKSFYKDRDTPPPISITRDYISKVARAMF